MACSKAMAPSRVGSPSSPKATGVGNCCPSSRMVVHPCSLGTRRPSARSAGVGPGGGYVQGFQDGPGHFGERGPGVHQRFHLLEPLAALVAYLKCYPESSHSAPSAVVSSCALRFTLALNLRGLWFGVPRRAVRRRRGGRLSLPGTVCPLPQGSDAVPRGPRPRALPPA